MNAQITNIDEYRDTLNASFDARRAHEVAKDADNSSMIKALDSYQNILNMTATLEVAYAANLAPDFVISTRVSGSYFNKYAIKKVAEMCALAAKLRQKCDKFDLATLVNARALDKKEVEYCSDYQLATCSDKISAESVKKSNLV